ncbi:fibronectin type III domain-containing protein [Lachnospiraceae bacterium]|nr:fibronectin type III domain-containing protein [Lachnospiraceae bacterium]
MKKYVSLILAGIIFFSSFGNDVVYAENNSMFQGQTAVHNGRDAMEAAMDRNEDTVGDDIEDGPQEKPELKTEAAVSDFTLEYNALQDVMILKYQVNHAVSYVDILVDGRPVQTEYSKVYTSYSYDLPDDAEGKKYTFQVIPYEIRNVEGSSVKIAGTPSEQKEYEIPYKQGVFTDLDAEYDLLKKYLIIEWFGDGISSVDIYLDGAAEPVVTGVQGNSYSMNIDWQPLSKHTYRVVPYNKIGQKGTEKTVELEVDDYAAVVDLLDVEYVPAKGEIKINWAGTNVKYVDIYMNDELLAENYAKEEFTLKYTPQAGASYLITVSPYNENGEPGEEAQDTLLEGEFEIPAITRLKETSSYGTDAEKFYTGFSKPAVNIKWTAEQNGCYEIYRAARDARSSYACIARVEVEKTGPYIYTDSNARIGSNYYKIRQVIKEDDYITQEVSTALSDSEEITIKLPKPKVNINLTAEGAVMFSMEGKKEFVSGYTILRKGRNGSYKQIAEVTDNTYTDSNTEFGRQYFYRVKSFYYDTKTRQKYYSPMVNVRAKNTVGSFAVCAQQTSEENVKITWEAAANAEGYEVYYKSATEGDSYKLLQITDQLELDAPLKEGPRYCFMVKAYKENNEKKIYFSTAETELKTGFTRPGNFRIAKTSFQYDKKTKALVRKDKLAWDKVYGAKGYYIDVYQPLKKKFKTVKRLKGADSTSYEVSNNLPPKTETVIYRVRSYAGEKRAVSENLEVRLQIGKVAGVTVSRAGDYARVTWKRTKGAELYRIYRSNGRSSTLVGTTDKLKYTDKGLSAGVTYQYYVQAVSNTLKSEGEYSDPVEYKKKLVRVDFLSASSSDKQNVNLEWMSDDGASGHIIYCREGNSGEYQMLARVNGSRTYYTHKNVTPGTTYCYKVSRMEINAGGVETESDTQKVKITIKAPQGNKSGKNNNSQTKNKTQK